MHINELKKSNFLKKEDCGNGILVTIKNVTQENIAKEGAPEELKWCIHFNEVEKPMVLNSTNGQLIAAILTQDDTDNWTGHKVVLYNDPTVSFGGKIMAASGSGHHAAQQQPRPSQRRNRPSRRRHLNRSRKVKMTRKFPFDLCPSSKPA